MEDSPRPGPAVTEDNITAVENVIRENRRVTVKEMASLLDISVGSAHHIIHDEPKFRKVCARWYPSDWHLKWKRGMSMLAKIFCVGMRLMVKHFCSVSSLGMRVGYTSTSQNESNKAWGGATPRPQNRRRCRCNDLQAKSCWLSSGIAMGITLPVTIATYSNLLWEDMKPAIRQKRRGLLTMGVYLLHKNARPNTATAAVSTIEELRFECIPDPPYSPDLALSDFHVGPLKDALSETQFRDDDEVRYAVHEWLHTRLKEFFSRGICTLVKCWCKCIELGGDYVE